MFCWWQTCLKLMDDKREHDDAWVQTIMDIQFPYQKMCWHYYMHVCPAKVIQFQAKMVSCKYIHRWSFSKLLPTSHGFHVVELSLTHLLVVIVWTCRWLVTSIADLLTSSVLGPFFVLHWCLFKLCMVDVNSVCMIDSKHGTWSQPITCDYNVWTWKTIIAHGHRHDRLTKM